MSSSGHQVYLRRSSSPSLLGHNHARSSSSFSSSSSSASLSSLSTSTSFSSGAGILPPARKAVVAEPPSDCCSGRFGEVAGETAAECAAICCCCPCGLIKLLVVAIYKLPAGLCRRAIRRKRREKLIKKGILPARASRRCRCGCDDTEIHIHPAGSRRVESDDGGKEWLFFGIREESEAMVSLEKEMWETFYGTGFWRSPSQREPLPPLPPPPAPASRRVPSSCSSPSKTKLL